MTTDSSVAKKFGLSGECLYHIPFLYTHIAHIAFPISYNEEHADTLYYFFSNDENALKIVE